MQSFDTKKQPKHTGQADNLAFFGKQEGQKGQRWTVVHAIVIASPVIPVLDVYRALFQIEKDGVAFRHNLIYNYIS